MSLTVTGAKIEGGPNKPPRPPPPPRSIEVGIGAQSVRVNKKINSKNI